MKEALIILAVVGVLLILTAVRYRRHIAGAIQIWRSLQTVRKQMNQGKSGADRQESIPAGKLVNCARCGTWVPENRAINLRGGASYCSSACLEKTADVY